jgi:predicted helicase
MSLYSIKQYHDKKEKIIKFSGSKNETTIRNAFYILLNDYAKTKHLEMVTEVSIKANNSKKTITPDGILKDNLRQDYGYWESKDEKDILDDEIKLKLSKGYPNDNILFEDSQTAVLIQNNIEVMRVNMQDSQALHTLLTEFINFERPEVREFRQAIEYFKQDIPKVTQVLRELIKQVEIENTDYLKLSKSFLALCHESINPNVTKEDIREMMIQHILTENIFNRIFGEDQFHRENTVARELENVIHSFFTGDLRRTVLDNIQHYYNTINARAASIANHHEKQKFLKVIYEVFYKSYNPKAADRLGVVYTPNEIVRFMIESTDYLLHTHFNKFLEDKDVEILDPATGTGTFICDLIDYINNEEKLDYKYKNELHANEVAILPYYISNLNIEFTYKQKMGKSCEFKNLCFVDTLDNMGFSYKGKQSDIVSSLTEENTKRIKNQNNKKISVVIGNPPYNANQLNENENNKNREYSEIDTQIKNTFIKESSAQKTKVYDMYARFYRWAIDRIDDKGIIAFVTNRSFIDSRTFDGFRKCIQTDFDFAYIIDTKSDVRANPKIAGTTHNVFGIQTGVAIMFLVRKENRAKNAQCVINYMAMQDEWRKEEKLQFLVERHLNNITFTHIQPDKNNNWINLAEDNDWESLLPIADKDVKLGKNGDAIFKLFSLGVVTARDEWVYDNSEKNLKSKVKYLIQAYNNDVKKLKGITVKDIANNLDYSIKWSRAVKNDLAQGKKYKFDTNLIIDSMYRPFVKKKLYFSKELNEMQYQLNMVFRNSTSKNKFISLTFHDQLKYPSILSGKNVWDYGYGARDSTGLPLYIFDKYDQKQDNITYWALEQFRKYYQNNTITKEDIFHYVYAVLHNPQYLEKYQLNLKRDFPRIPFYENFVQWAEYGKQLMELHLNYETAELYPLKRQNLKISKTPKAKLKADKEQGLIFIDDNTSLSEIPAAAWEYKLGNRSALEWILDQYKEKNPKDATIAEQFNTYRFADYKEQVIELLRRVCTVSVETVRIVELLRTDIN